MMALIPVSQAPVIVPHIAATPSAMPCQTPAAPDLIWSQTAWMATTPLVQSSVIRAHSAVAPAVMAPQARLRGGLHGLPQTVDQR